MMKIGRIDRTQWILIGVGLLCFLTIISSLIGVLTDRESLSISRLALNVLQSFPFVIAIAYLDYLLVKYIYRAEWLRNHLTIRILFEFTTISIFAIAILFISGLLFMFDMHFVDYLREQLSWARILPVVIMNVFAVTLIEIFVQSQRSKQRTAEFERLQTEYSKMQDQQLREQTEPLENINLPNKEQGLKPYKNRISVKLGDKFMAVDMANVAYFYAEERVTFVVTTQNRRYIVDYTLDTIEPMLDPIAFFRITRGCITSISSIESVSKYFNSRLKIKLTPDYDGELLVSRVRVPDFLKWLDGE